MKVLLIMFFLLFATSCIDKSITEPPKHKNYSIQEIKTKLLGNNFRAKLDARKQIKKLNLKDKLNLFDKLLKEGDMPSRMLAIGELAKLLPNDSAKSMLEQAAKSDPNQSIKKQAKRAKMMITCTVCGKKHEKMLPRTKKKVEIKRN